MQRQKVVTEWRQRKGTASIEKLGRVREWDSTKVFTELLILTKKEDQK
jgi:hypothetical protein